MDKLYKPASVFPSSRCITRYFLPLATLLIPTSAWADCPAGSTCVPPEDMKVFVQLLREKKCLQSEKPSFNLDPITIFTDKDGRTYSTGSHHYTLRMTWCGYQIEALGTVQVVAASMPTPTWGWHFRPKAALGFLVADALGEDSATRGIDVGLLLEPFYAREFNLNGYVGVRSGGAGVGFNLTRSFGGYVGYAFSWGSRQHNPHAALYFAFW